MRIGIITGEYPPMRGGVGAFSHILGTELARHGHEVFVLSSKNAYQQDNQVPVETVNNWGWTISRRVNQWADNHQLDIINLQYQTAAFGMSPWIHFLPDRTNVPLVTTFHDLRFPYLFPKAGPLRTWIVRHLAQASAGCIVTNEEDQHMLGTRHPLTQLIRIGSNIRETDSQARVIELPDSFDDAFVVGYFGFINHSKGLDVLIQALAMLKLDRPVKLLIIGERLGDSDPTNAQYARDIDNLIAEYGLEDQIFYTGYVMEKEVATYLKRCDLVALPFRDGASFRRGTLMAAIEQECAIITTQPAISIPTISEDYFCLVPVEQPRALADAITQLATDDCERDRLRNSIGAIKSEFAWGTIAQQTEAFFEIVMRGHRAQS